MLIALCMLQIFDRIEITSNGKYRLTTRGSLEKQIPHDIIELYRHTIHDILPEHSSKIYMQSG